MAVQFDTGIFSVEGISGEILVGAKLYWYVTGTSTPQATYIDRDLTTPNANPVVADAAGRFGPIWLQSLDYKMVLTDADDVVLVTRDPVAGGYQNISASGTISAGGQFRGYTGSTPAYSFTGYTTTGYGARPGDILDLYTAGEGRISIIASGKVQVFGQRGLSGFGFGNIPGDGNFLTAPRTIGGTARSLFDLTDYTADEFIRQISGVNTVIGSITVGVSAVAFNTTSDQDLKNDLGSLSPETAWAILKLVTIHKHTWKVSGQEDENAFAQELYQIYPKAVTKGGWKDPETQEWSETPIEGQMRMPWGVDYSKLVPLIVPVVQGIMARQDDFATRIEHLEAA